MSTTKPEPQDFGITPEEYTIYSQKSNVDRPSGSTFLIVLIVLASVVASIVFVVTKDWAPALGAAVLAFVAVLLPPTFFIAAPVVLGTASLCETAIARIKRSRLLKSPVASRIKLYEKAETAYRVAQEEAWKEYWGAERKRVEDERQRQEAERQRRKAERIRRRKLEKYWQSLDGLEFERELGIVFRNLGYRVKLTPTSGDQGVDLVLKKDGETTVVQCKAHKHGVGPAVARELYGSLVAHGAQYAILACSGGFTKGVYEFAQGKPLQLLSAPDIARMAEGHDDEAQDITERAPICPMPGCGKMMVLRKGKYGSFWGCPRYPKCRGTRRDH